MGETGYHISRWSDSCFVRRWCLFEFALETHMTLCLSCVSCSNDQTCRLWNFASGNCLQVLRWAGNHCTCLCLPEIQRFGLCKSRGHAHVVECVAFSPPGLYIEAEPAISGAGGEAADMAKAKAKALAKKKNDAGGRYVAFSMGDVLSSIFLDIFLIRETKKKNSS